MSNHAKAASLSFVALIVAIVATLFTAETYGTTLNFDTMIPFLTGIIMVLMLVADLASFRMRPSAARSSLYLVGLTAAVLFLPPSGVLLAACVSLALSAVVRKVEPLKAIYQTAVGVIASVVMISIHHQIVGDNVLVNVNTPELFTLKPLMAAIFAALCYGAVHFFLIGLRPSVLSKASFKKYITDNANFAFWASLSSAVLGALLVAVVASSPLLLPLMILPAWGLMKVFKTAFIDRETSARSLRVSEAVELLNSNSEPTALLSSFLNLAKDIHGADEALAIREMNSELEVIIITEDGFKKIEPTRQIINLLETVKREPKATLLPSSLTPNRWTSAFTAPIEISDGFFGMVALGFKNYDRKRVDDLPLWGSLTSALGVALSQVTLFARIEAITESQGEGVIALDDAGKIVFLNPSAKRLFSLENVSYHGDNLKGSLTAGLKTYSFQELLTESITEPEGLRFTDAVLKLDNGDHAVNCTVKPLPSSASGWVSGGVVFVFEDRAAQKAAQKALAASQDQIIALGRALQASLLPPVLPKVPNAQIAARYHAAAGGLDIGGDFYDVLNTRDEHFNIIMGDVSGRGPEAAALTALTRHTLRGAVGTDPSPIKALTRLNEAIYANNDDMFCTVAMGRLRQPVDGVAELTVTLGGHPPVLVLRADGSVEEVKPIGTLIGAFREIKLTEETVQLYSGDAVIFYTDGVLEARGPDGTFFEAEGLEKLLSDLGGRDAESIAFVLDEAIKSFQGGILHDDTAFLVVTID